jgi:hypothetical protein
MGFSDSDALAGFDDADAMAQGPDASLAPGKTH